ncbi:MULTISPECIES: putative quinol monooxygenase [Eikenella]|uniref:Antibiotic biosynthesis monooxygenase n=1 Tax=Eikenella longinqua TaxID=1795827 RepID=A0A1A9RW11_9NEIS|nr:MULTISPECIES: antibiotic biosynthesis monooxygenase [Eikenella]OAM26778.1 antibiotic biosynthesis monooxygenase [Eikenella longinqua]
MKKYLAAAVAALSLSAQAAPVFNIFELGIQNGQTAAYDEVGRNNITTSIRGEKGTLAMYSAKRADNPEIAYMIEIYADEAAYQVHTQSPQYKNFLQKSPEILTDHKRKISVEPQFLGDKRVRQTARTINNLVIVDVKPEHAHAFKNIVLPEMAQSLKVERGVLAMYAATEQGNPSRWYFYEIYESEAAYQAHRQTPHFQDYLTRTADMAANKEAVAITPALLMNKGGLRFEQP